MKRLISMTCARFSPLSVVIVRCAHSKMRLFQSNSLKMDSQSQHCSNVSLEQFHVGVFPKTQFRSRRRCQTRQWPRRNRTKRRDGVTCFDSTRWWNRTKRRKRSSLTRSKMAILLPTGQWYAPSAVFKDA